jgi:ADP-ribosyl-[dinitrogen reductase] hydrolase
MEDSIDLLVWQARRRAEVIIANPATIQRAIEKGEPIIPELAIHYAAGSSRTTHAAPAAVDACRYYTALIVGALNGRSKEHLLSPDFYYGALVPEIAEVAAGSFKEKNPPAIAGSGYVVKSLEAALWAFYRSDTFEKGALLAANLGDDADTTAAIYGQLAGSFYDVNAIPEKWLQKLSMRERITELADNLLALSESLPPAKEGGVVASG